MGYKKPDKQISFADLILKDSMDKNRCLEQLFKPLFLKLAFFF
jgi:hypothetical protein